MKPEAIDILIEPFPEAAVRTRRGGHGKELRYLETWRVIERLNLAFSHDWAFRLLEWKLLENEIVVHAELEAAGVIKQAFGSSSITRSRDSGEAIGIGDDAKSAASDALKKSATMLGVGLELYAGKNGHAPETNHAGPRATPGAEPRNRSQISERQLYAILALARTKGDGEVSVRTKVLDSFGVPIEKLDRRQASEIISALNNGGIGPKAGAGGVG